MRIYFDSETVEMKHVLEEEKTRDFFNAFPHVAHRVTLFWGQPEGRPYLNSLISETRGETRQGFPNHFFPTILKLIEVHDKEHPKFIPKKDLWDI